MVAHRISPDADGLQVQCSVLNVQSSPPTPRRWRRSSWSDVALANNHRSTDTGSVEAGTSHLPSVRGRICLGLTLALCVAANLGCGSRPNLDSGTSSEKKATVRDSSNDPVPGPQTEPPLTSDTEKEPIIGDTKQSVPSVDRAGFDALVAKHKGKVVLVDYWATWCAPCRKKFPHTVALAKEHEADGLVVIGVSLDDKDSQEDIAKFLAEQNATFVNVRAANGADDIEAFEIPNESIPCLRLFDRDGQVIKTFAIDPEADKQFTDDDIAEAVKAALAK